jgi:hypothetical protein
VVSKKNSSNYTSAHAALGGRTLKTGQSRWFVGYKKHTLRLWLPTGHPSVTLVPLVSWLTPGNVAEGGLLRPSLHWCRGHLGWWPGIVVADMGTFTKLLSEHPLIAPFLTDSQNNGDGWQASRPMPKGTKRRGLSLLAFLHRNKLHGVTNQPHIRKV